MSLVPGSSVGPYQVVGHIGSGGMGEVYRARDAKLQRDVAIKVLPALFAADADRLARFEREAQTLAALNHPHVAQIYGVLEDPPAHLTRASHAGGRDSGHGRLYVARAVDARRLRKRIAMSLVRATTTDVAFLYGTHDVLTNTAEGGTLVNVDTGSARLIRRAVPPLENHASGDGRTLLLERPALEADLWLMELRR